MSSQTSFTHLVNPFPGRPNSEHAVASGVTWRTLRAAHEYAGDAGLSVKIKAVILPGDESAVEAPAESTVYLDRTVQDVARLNPPRPLPLIEDILRVGARDADTTHVVFTNMDISVQRHFYTALEELIRNELGPDVPFTIGRRNIDPSLADEPLEKLYVAEGTGGHGSDCFVIPRPLIEQLDLGACCIGAPHFDLLLFMVLDVLSGYRVTNLSGTGLTFHLGNNIAWAAMLDYVEHNLAESVAVIERMRREYAIRPGSKFDNIDKGHFCRNNTWTSAMLRKIRRIPLLTTAILHTKRALGRQY